MSTNFPYKIGIKTLMQVHQLTGVTLEEIVSRSRVERIALARHLAAYWMKVHHKLHPSDIGDLIQRNRTTVIYSEMYIRDQIMIKDEYTMRMLDKLKKLNEKDKD